MKTDWYPADVKPVRIGVYETDLGPSAFSRFGFSYWDGNHWGNQYATCKRAEDLGDMQGIQDKPWRGITEKAK